MCQATVTIFVISTIWSLLNSIRGDTFVEGGMNNELGRFSVPKHCTSFRKMHFFVLSTTYTVPSNLTCCLVTSETLFYFINSYVNYLAQVLAIRLPHRLSQLRPTRRASNPLHHCSTGTSLSEPMHSEPRCAAIIWTRSSRTSQRRPPSSSSCI